MSEQKWKRLSIKYKNVKNFMKLGFVLREVGLRI